MLIEPFACPAINLGASLRGQAARDSCFQPNPQHRGVASSTTSPTPISLGGQGSFAGGTGSSSGVYGPRF